MSDAQSPSNNSDMANISESRIGYENMRRSGKAGAFLQMDEAEVKLTLTPEQMHRLRLITMHFPDSDVTLGQFGDEGTLAVEISDQYGETPLARLVLRSDGGANGSRVDGSPLPGMGA